MDLMVTAVPTLVKLLQITIKTQLLWPFMPLLSVKLWQNWWQRHIVGGSCCFFLPYMKARRYCHACACTRVSSSPVLQLQRLFIFSLSGSKSLRGHSSPSGHNCHLCLLPPSLISSQIILMAICLPRSSTPLPPIDYCFADASQGDERALKSASIDHAWGPRPGGQARTQPRGGNFSGHIWQGSHGYAGTSPKCRRCKCLLKACSSSRLVCAGATVNNS